jgi:hypothetical protein
MIAAFQPRNHRFRHQKPLCQLLLCLACVSTQFKQAPSALRRNCDAVVGRLPRHAALAGLLHEVLRIFAKSKPHTIARPGQADLRNHGCREQRGGVDYRQQQTLAAAYHDILSTA